MDEKPQNINKVVGDLMLSKPFNDLFNLKSTDTTADPTKSTDVTEQSL